MVRDSISHSYYVTLQGIKHIHDKNREEQLINVIKHLRVQWNLCALETTLGPVISILIVKLCILIIQASYCAKRLVL